MIRRTVLLALLLAAHSAAAAEGQAIAAKIGMLGIGVEYSYGLTKRLAVRAGLNGSQAGFSATKSGIDYAFNAVWSSVAVGVDFHPLKGPLRVSAGLLHNGDKLEARSRVASNITVGGNNYTSAQVGTLQGDVTFRSMAPYVSVGWDWSRKRRRHFGMSFDVGVLSEGTPRVTLTADGSLVSDPTFAQDLATEQQQFQASLSNFDTLPFATLGFVFRF